MNSKASFARRCFVWLVVLCVFFAVSIGMDAAISWRGGSHTDTWTLSAMGMGLFCAWVVGKVLSGDWSRQQNLSTGEAMQVDERESFMPPSKKPSSFWPVVGWVVYVLFGVLATLVALTTAGPWFGLALALCIIFGPKVWRNVR